MNHPQAHVYVHTSPHLREAQSVDKIMQHVVYALLPIVLFAIYLYGLSAILLIISCTGTCVLCELIYRYFKSSNPHPMDWSSVITGILLALCLPPGFPLWMAIVSSCFAMFVGKLFFGGLGMNIMNPALVGRAFAQASFTVPITSWIPVLLPDRFASVIPSTLTPPFLKANSNSEWLQAFSIDAWTGATPLALMKYEGIETKVSDMLIGWSAGSAGESAALLIFFCGIYLVIRKMMNWKIPFSILLTVFILSSVFYAIDSSRYPSPLFSLCSGGLMLGAVFMASDMVGSPVTSKGVWLYGILIGCLSYVIRQFGGLNEGVMYAILLGNACSPLIDKFCQPKVFGSGTKTRVAS